MRPTSLTHATHRAFVICAVLSMAAALTVALIPRATAAPNCPDVVVIGARGSDEFPQVPADYANPKPDPDFWIGPRLAPTYRDFKSRNDKKGITTEVIPVNYPAYDVNLLNPLNGDATAGYAESVKLGMADTATQVRAVLLRGCAITPQIILLGYSQGALAVEGGLNHLNSPQRSKVTGVLLFGDPMYDPTKSFAKGGVGVLGGPGLLLGLKSLIKLNKWTSLLKLLPLLSVFQKLPPDMAKRTYDYCYPQDPACQPLASGAQNIQACIKRLTSCPHMLYETNPYGATEWLQGRVKKIQPVAAPPPPLSVSPRTGPSGIAMILSSTCPAAATHVNVDETQIVGRRLASVPVDANHGWTATISTFVTIEPNVMDPQSGLSVWGPITWNLYVSCAAANGAILQFFPTFAYFTTHGLALKTSITTTSTSYAVQVSPSSPCPAGSTKAIVSSYSEPLGSSDSSPWTYTPSATDASGNWAPVSVTVPRYASGTVIKIAAICRNPAGLTGFTYTPPSVSFPAGA